MRGGEELASSYANVCNVIATPEEVYLQFGQRDADNSIEARIVSKICLSLPEAKRLTAALTGTVASYEEAFRSIAVDTAARLTPEVRKRLGLPPAEEKQSAR